MYSYPFPAADCYGIETMPFPSRLRITVPPPPYGYFTRTVIIPCQSTETGLSLTVCFTIMQFVTLCYDIIHGALRSP